MGRDRRHYWSTTMLAMTSAFVSRRTGCNFTVGIRVGLPQRTCYQHYHLITATTATAPAGRSGQETPSLLCLASRFEQRHDRISVRYSRSRTINSDSGGNVNNGAFASPTRPSCMGAGAAFSNGWAQTSSTSMSSISGLRTASLASSMDTTQAEGKRDSSDLMPRSGGKQVAEPGTVYFVATPIGNLEDITLRAMNILRTADVIAAEDTRTTGSLLKLLGVERKGRLVSHHDHNTKRRVPEIVDAAREGKSVAVVSDAGTPGISDPGEELAAACAAEGVRVVPVPGACAAVAAVSVAGFSSHEFVFFGFVAGKRGSAVRRRKLAEIAQEVRTCVLYESPHRIADTLRGLLAVATESAQGGMTSRPVGGESTVAGDGGNQGREAATEATGTRGGSTVADVSAGRRHVVLARELTKLHEEIFRGTLAEAVARYGTGEGAAGATAEGVTKDAARGEFTVVLGPRAAADASDSEGEGEARAMAALETRLLELTAGGMSTSSAVKMASRDFGFKKSDVYRVALALPSLGSRDNQTKN